MQHSTHKPAKKHTFWDLFSLMEGGRLKSTLLLYSFVLGFVYLAFYLASYLLLLGPIDRLLPGGMAVPLKNLLEAALPSAAATALCLLFFLWVKDKRLVPLGFLWMTAYVLIVAVLLLATLAPDQRGDFLRLLLMFGWAPVLLGGGSTLALYCRLSKHE